MVARWMQPKLLKMKRMRRAWAKPYGCKRLPPDNQNFGFVQVSKDKDGQPVREFVSLAMGARNRAAKTVIDPWLDTLFKNRQPNHPDKLQVYLEDSGGQSHLVLSRVVQSHKGAGSLQGADKFVKHMLMDGPTWKVAIYFARETAFFVEWRKSPSQETTKRSVFYTSREIAMAHFDNNYNNISWVERHTTPAVDVPSASPPSTG